jgi:hypothetical protein
MKALLVIVGLVVAAGAGAAGGALCTGMCPLSCPSDAVEVVKPPSVVTPGPAVMPAEAQQRLDALSMELGNLQTQIAALRAEKSREPAGVTAATEVAAASPESTAVFAAVHRDAILKVIDDREAEIARKREEERKQREEQQLVARADRVATRLNMSEGQKQLLVTYYASERARMEEVRMQARDVADGTPGAAREAFQAAQEWRTTELTRLFGTELGGQIRDAEGGDRRGVMGGGGGGGRARGGNGNGGNAGGAGPGQAAGGG